MLNGLSQKAIVFLHINEVKSTLAGIPGIREDEKFDKFGYGLNM